MFCLSVYYKGLLYSKSYVLLPFYVDVQGTKCRFIDLYDIKILMVWRLKINKMCKERSLRGFGFKSPRFYIEGVKSNHLEMQQVLQIDLKG